MKKSHKYVGWISYLVSLVLLVVSFFLPPTGSIDSSVLIAVSILIGGGQLIFGSSIKELHINKEGITVINKD